MKRIVLFLLLLCFVSQLKSQNNCYRERGRSIYDIDTGCLRVLPTDIYDTALLALSYIPNENTPIITIHLSISMYGVKMMEQAIGGRTLPHSGTVCNWFLII